jgi:hypothetical protein
MPSKLFSLRQRIHRSRPQASNVQPQARKYYLGTTIIPSDDHFGLGDASISDPAWHISMYDDIAMSAIQTSLAALKEGSALAANLPFIAPIAGLLLQALTMRDARVTHISSDSVLMITSPGSEAIQRGVRNSDAQTHQNCEDCRQFV